MTAISPFRILKSSGNSSSEVERRNLPYFVSLTSSGSRLPFSSFSQVIVRNFISLKIFSSLPGRSCVKKGFPFIIIAPRIINTKNTGDRTIIAHSDRNKSSGRFMYFAYIYDIICEDQLEGVNYDSHFRNSCPGTGAEA